MSHEQLLDRLDRCLVQAAQHAGRVLLQLEELRGSVDPADKALYREVHDLMSDLGGAHVFLAVLTADVELAAG